MGSGPDDSGEQSTGFGAFETRRNVYFETAQELFIGLLLNLQQERNIN